MTKPTLSPQRLAELLQRYPHESNRQLAAAFGITTHQVGNLAFNHGVKKFTGTPGRPISPAHGAGRALCQAIQASGKAGMGRSEAVAALPHFRHGTLCTALRTLTQRGLLHRAGRPHFYRWFTEVEHALAHEASSRGATQPVVKVATQRGPGHSAAAPVVTKSTRHTVCPPTGWRTPPAAPTAGPFSSLPPGRYLDAEAKPWVSSITQR